MKTILQICPQCRAEHALCWHVRKGGVRELGVLCDHDTVVRTVKGDVTCVDHQKFIPVEDSKACEQDLTGIPSFLTPAAKKELQNRAQIGMALMLVKDGETVERTVELPRESDEDAVVRLTAEIDQRLQACAELDSKIRKLENQKLQIKAEAQALGAELSKHQTGKLFYENAQTS